MKQVPCNAVLALLVVGAGGLSACGSSPAARQWTGDRDGAAPGQRDEDGGGGAGGGGMTSVPCHSHDVDIPSAALAGAVTVNGEPASLDSSTRLLLRNEVNDLVEIPFAGPRYSVRVAPGSYEVFYAATGPASLGPLNRFARLHTGPVVVGSGTTTLDVDVPQATVAGAITINGAALAADDAVSLWLRNAEGDAVPLASNSTGSYAARVVPGTFDLFLASSVAGAGSATPRNQLARIGGDVVITAGATTLDVDVPSAQVSGTITIGSVPAETSSRGRVYLRGATGDVVELAIASSAAYTARVVPGSYDLYFTGNEDAYSVANQNVRLRTGVVVRPTGVTTLDVQVPSAMVAGTLRLDGAPPLDTDSAHLVLRNAAGDYAPIPWNSEGRYTVNVVPGTYDLFYSKDNTIAASTPANQLAKLRTGVVVAAVGTTVLDIDVTSTTVMGAVKINGEPAAAGNSGVVTLRSADGDRVLIANTAAPTFFARVVPGTYDLYYTRTATPANTTTAAPANHAAKLRSGIVLAPGLPAVFDIEIPSTTVSGAVTINGVVAGPADHGSLLVQSATGDFAPFASTVGGAYTARLIPGSYQLYYSHAGKVGDTTPMNTRFKLRCFTVQ